jgi:integrase
MIQNCQGRAATLCDRFSKLLAECGFRPNVPHDIIVGHGRDGRRRRYDLSFHSLRHTAVTLLKEAGTPQAVAMEFIGDDSPAISMNYTHVGAEALKKAAAALPEISPKALIG